MLLLNCIKLSICAVCMYLKDFGCLYNLSVSLEAYYVGGTNPKMTELTYILSAVSVPGSRCGKPKRDFCLLWGYTLILLAGR